MLPRESKELTLAWVKELVRIRLNYRGAIRAAPLATNNFERHKNWNIVLGKTAYLLRVENPLTNKIRGMYLKDEIALLKLLAPFRVAPRLIRSGRHEGRRFLIEEWIPAKPLSAPPRLTEEHYRSVIAFAARVNRIPLSAISREFHLKDDCLDHLDLRRRDFVRRIRAGDAIPEFRPVIRDTRPLFTRGFQELARRVRAIPKSAFKNKVLSYRDISRTNIFATKPHLTAIDWERHSVGVADPSLSLVVLMQRFGLSGRKKWIINEYQKLRRAPHLEALVEARIIERLLGGLTWSLGRAARMQKLHLPRRILATEIRSGITTIRARQKELEAFLRRRFSL